MLICAALGNPDHGSLNASRSFSFAVETSEMAQETFMTFHQMNMHLVTGENIINYFVCLYSVMHAYFVMFKKLYGQKNKKIIMKKKKLKAPKLTYSLF